MKGDYRERKPLEERFWEKVLIVPFYECWEWQAGKRNFGYGTFSMGRNRTGLRAHRVSYEMRFGEIPDGLVICHRCDNPACVRPEHLFLGTKKDNSQDMIRKGRGRGHFKSGSLDPRSNGGKYNLLKTHCPSGHPYSGENLYISKTNRRHCKECSRLRMKQIREGKLYATTNKRSRTSVD